jgi:hypothetical protein
MQISFRLIFNFRKFSFKTIFFSSSKNAGILETEIEYVNNGELFDASFNFTIGANIYIGLNGELTENFNNQIPNSTIFKFVIWNFKIWNLLQ